MCGDRYGSAVEDSGRTRGARGKSDPGQPAALHMAVLGRKIFAIHLDMAKWRHTLLDMDSDTHSLQDLADLSGIEARTIRSYIERGMLPGPESLGRSARYSRENLHRLRVIALLRDAKRDITLDQVRLLLQQLSPGQIEGIASGKIHIGGLIESGDSSTPSLVAPSAASQYLAEIRQASRRAAALPAAQSSARVGSAPAKHRDVQQVPPFEQLATALADLTGTTQAPRTVRSEAWHRIAVTPDIELAVRGDFAAEQLAQLHRIGDALRVLLTRGVRQ